MTRYICKIHLNSETATFHTGDVVSGSVLLEFKNDEKLNLLYCDIIGKCKAQWTRPMPTVPYIRVYSEKRQVLFIRINLLGNKDEEESGRKHLINFRFILPEDIPSTFHSSVAKVKYKILLRGESETNIKCKEELTFTVLRKVDLMEVEGLLVPSVFKMQKKFMTAGCVTVSVRVCTGFVCGQNIPFVIHIINENEKRISKVRIELIRKIEYKVKTGYLNDEKALCYSENKHISHSKLNKFHMNMSIPETVPSSINEINAMVNISYAFRVEISFLFHFSIYEDIPITVGC